MAPSASISSIANFFASAFGLIAAVTDEPFFAQLQSSPDPATQIDYLYFSFVTITTVGYGDLTAAADLGRMTAVFEAILGQLYLITVVAIVVQNLGNEHLGSRNARGAKLPRPPGGTAKRIQTRSGRSGHDLGRCARGLGGLTQRRGRQRSWPLRRSVRPQRVPCRAPRQT